MPSGEWRDRLENLKARVLTPSIFYVAWNAVEPREGEFNFNTPNLRQFISLCKN
ncbi:MAG: beta-galactosidase [Moraxellaceae bacterium]|nr:beta-galactosidase [Moraxellaceae bacterium]